MKMDFSHVVVTAILLDTVAEVDGVQVCQDLDPTACALMQQNDPNLCQNEATAAYACPKFCNQCALNCFHCDDVTRDPANCTNVKTCAVGEKCLLARLSSSIDGHHEYKMNCASPYRCEGSEYMNILGRRSPDRRTIITECCDEDRCNNPAFNLKATSTTSSPMLTTTANACLKDVEIMMEQTPRQTSHDVSDMKNFTKTLINSLNVGPRSSNVGISVFDTRVYQKRGLFNQTDQALAAVDNAYFSHHGTDYVNVNDVISFLTADALSDNRNGVDKVVVLVFDQHAKLSTYHNYNHHVDLSSLQQLSHDVIVINVGSSDLTDVFSNLATDSQHVLTVPDYNRLQTVIQTLVSLICS